MIFEKIYVFGRAKILGNIYTFRGKAATGKSTLANMLAKELSIPIFRVDDIVDALKMIENTDKEFNYYNVCYNVLYKMVQTNLDLETDFIIDAGLSNRNGAKYFYNRLCFKDIKPVGFFIICSNENEWRRRHEERIMNPQPNQIFKSFEDVIEYYKNSDVGPLENEHIIDTADTFEKCCDKMLKIISLSN